MANLVKKVTFPLAYVADAAWASGTRHTRHGPENAAAVPLPDLLNSLSGQIAQFEEVAKIHKDSVGLICLKYYLKQCIKQLSAHQEYVRSVSCEEKTFSAQKHAAICADVEKMKTRITGQMNGEHCHKHKCPNKIAVESLDASIKKDLAEVAKLAGNERRFIMRECLKNERRKWSGELASFNKEWQAMCNGDVLCSQEGINELKKKVDGARKRVESHFTDAQADKCTGQTGCSYMK